MVRKSRKRSRKFIFLMIIIIGLIGIYHKDIGRYIFPINYKAPIELYAKTYELDPLFVASVVRVESNYNEKAKSHKGAMGLMQIMPKTGEWAADTLGIPNFEVNTLYDPDLNIRLGCWYLDQLNRQFDDNHRIVLAAYNAGSGNVSKWLKNKAYSPNGRDLDVIPFEETRKYVEKVTSYYKIYRYFYGQDQ